MRILYISAHAILEYDEINLLTELGHDVFSLGAYTNPDGHHSLPRPAIKNGRYHPELEEMIRNVPRTELPLEFVEKFDVIILMDGYHATSVMQGNWEIFKTKKVVWRTIGQSIPTTEMSMRRYRNHGMKIIRYSPMESDLDSYIGGDTLIRFYKDPDEFSNWNGNTLRVVNLSQSLKARRDFCGYDTAMKVGPGFPFKVYGTGNDDLGEWNGGELTYDALKGLLRDARVFLYLGTWPASYTLGFMEAMMTGIPVVSVGKDLWRHKDNMSVKIFEVPKMIQKPDEGFWSDDINELKEFIKKLLDDHAFAKQISEKGRAKAIKLFGKETIREQWRSFLATI